MIKYYFLFLSPIIFLISGCASTTSFDKAKIIVKENLPYPQFTEYRNLKVFPGDVICGEFESPDIGLRYVTGWRKFIVVKGEMGPSNTLEATDIFCSEDSALSLYKTLGIDLRGSKHEKIIKIQNDLSILLPIIYEYQRLNGMLPPSGGGLSILLSDGTVNGLLDTIPKDPWGKPYNYSSVQWGGSASQHFKLWTYGKDNKEGGVGEDADISHQHLPYLLHVGSLPKEK